MLDLTIMNNPVEVIDEAVILPELAAPKLEQLTRTVLRNSTTQRDATRRPPQSGQFAALITQNRLPSGSCMIT